MKSRLSLLCVLLLSAAQAPPQDQAMSLDDLRDSVEEWVRDRAEETLRQTLADVDQQEAVAVLDGLLRRMAADSVYDLSRLKPGVLQIIPLLEQWEETQPYASWLRTRLDYFEAAEELRHGMQPAAPPKRGTPLSVPPATSTLERTVWDRRLAQRPAPAAASRFVTKLKPIFAAEKVPPQLVWLAEVESSFDPSAKSPAGAAGLFQLMKPTARSLGLSTWLPDERLHPEKSARAAARYLRHLHGRFGDWRLALAAYNAGESRMSTLLQGQKVRTFEAIRLRLPAETQMFVPKLEATLRKREGVALTALERGKN